MSVLFGLVELVRHELHIRNPMTKEEKKARSAEIIKNHVGFSLGAALIPMPAADLLAVSAVQLNMLRQLAGLYKVSFMDTLGKNIISAVAGSSAARLGASLVKAIPGVGTIVGELSMPVLSGASTYALGRVVANHLYQGGTLDDLDLRNARKGYQSEMENGKRVAEEMTLTEPKPRYDTDDALFKLEKLAEMKDAGVLTEAEFQKLKEKLLAQI
ncbi:MAG: DUF697 domain-containing protein [Lewinellaceae bacterium]|nr:DUF697 domain-containing protein [Lewinellaceae bacterium]